MASTATKTPTEATHNDDSTSLSVALDPPKPQPENAPTPLPWRSLSVVLCIVISEGFASGFLLPFVSYMVISFGYPEESVGYYAGYITSAFYLAQLFKVPVFSYSTATFPCSFLLGYVSDLKGRRPIMLLGLAGNILSSVAFGFSKSLWFALACRLVAGFLNGNTGVVKSYIREITDLSNQARAYSIRSSGYAIGAIIGPFAGGALARPAERWPTVFSATGIFGIYPYLLPCVVAGAINLLGLVLGYFYLQETVNLPQDEATDGTSDDAEKQSQVINKNKHNLGFNSESFIEGLKKTTSLFMKAMKDHEVLVTMVLYAILAFVWLSFDEVFAIWALRPPEEGGVNFDEAQIGMAHAVSGVAMLFLQVFIYPPIDKKVGTLQVFNIAVIILAPVVAAMPFSNALVGNSVLLWICVGSIMMLKSSMGTMGMAGVNLMLSNAAEPETVGAVNGLSSSVAAFSRLLAPSVSGITYAWSSNSGNPFPFDYHLIFLLLGLISIGMYLISKMNLHSSINVRKSAATSPATPQIASTEKPDK